jgi:hypothetical protein
MIMVKAPTTAKRKQPTRVEIMRNINAKLHAKAKASPLVLDIDKARASVIGDTGKAQGSARVYAHALIARHGADYYTFTAANSRTDNEKAHFNAIEAERKQCAAEYAAKWGEEGKNMPWSRAKAIAKALREGGNTERVAKPLDTLQRTGLIALYKKGMKEERQTEMEADCNADIGALLIKYFKEDLSKLG